MRHRIGRIFKTLGLLCLIAAIALRAYNWWDNWRAGQSVAELQDTLEEEKEARRQEKLSGSLSDTEEIGEGDTAMGTVTIEGNEYIGTLSIPRYGLELPVMAEWSYPGLKIAPGRYRGSVWSDDLIICGHNYERHFGNLKNLEAGDSISFTDVDGNVFDYQVDEVLILQPTAIEEMVDQETSDWDLTLFTCTIGGQTRVTVRCSRVDE